MKSIALLLVFGFTLTATVSASDLSSIKHLKIVFEDKGHLLDEKAEDDVEKSVKEAVAKIVPCSMPKEDAPKDADELHIYLHKEGDGIHVDLFIDDHDSHKHLWEEKFTVKAEGEIKATVMKEVEDMLAEIKKAMKK
jgi:hypothetical protein